MHYTIYTILHTLYTILETLYNRLYAIPYVMNTLLAPHLVHTLYFLLLALQWLTLLGSWRYAQTTASHMCTMNFTQLMLIT